MSDESKEGKLIMNRRTFVAFITVMLLSGQVIGAEVVTFESLLVDMVDRTNIAKFPDVEFLCKQASSK